MAAEQGHRDAGFNLGGLYATGRGVSPDLEQAYKWFSVAAAEGDRDSLAATEKIAPKMTAQQVQKAKAMAAAWKPCKSKEECDARLQQ
jgi:localization factor PodJL